ncbi:MAG: hypothetical protein GX319_08370, partial [Clostridiales bacterium]|nr:hypothetical protein [Clostridiales bacterium]
MNKILMLTVSNIKKTIGHTISLFIMFLIAALLLNSGLLISINFNKFFNDTCNELNTSNIYYTMPSRIYDDELRQYIRDHENLISMQEEYSIWADVKVKYNDEERGLTLLMNDASFNRDLSKWKFVGEHLPVESDEMSIYLPSIFRESGNYNLNDN